MSPYGHLAVEGVKASVIYLQTLTQVRLLTKFAAYVHTDPHDKSKGIIYGPRGLLPCSADLRVKQRRSEYGLYTAWPQERSRARKANKKTVNPPYIKLTLLQCILAVQPVSYTHQDSLTLQQVGVSRSRGISSYDSSALNLAQKVQKKNPLKTREHHDCNCKVFCSLCRTHL